MFCLCRNQLGRGSIAWIWKRTDIYLSATRLATRAAGHANHQKRITYDVHFSNRDAQSSTGLAQPFKSAGNGTKRAAAKQLPAHLDKIWSAVTITSKEYTTNPMVTCNCCDHSFSGGSTRIADQER